ncbi:hypothetical protein Tco_0997851 [Tanacetum coccineum]
MQFLMGLDDTYMQIRNSILSRETPPDVRSAYAIILSEESHKVASGSLSGTSQRSQTSAFNVNAPSRGNFQMSQTSTSFSRPSNENKPNDNGNKRTVRGSALERISHKKTKNQAKMGQNRTRGGKVCEDEAQSKSSQLREEKAKKNIT